jgi:acyl carrier protein
VALCGLFGELLHRDQVGVESNFFELGGDSLVAMQLAVRVRTAMSTEMPVRALFDAPTVRDLARKLDSTRAGARAVPSASMELGKAAADPASPPLASFAQQRLWFLSQLHPDDPFYNVYLGVRLAGLLNPDALWRGVREIVRRHDVLRTTFALHDGEPVQIIRDDLAPEIANVDLRGPSRAEREERMHALAMEEVRRPFDLARGPLLRVTLVRLAEHEHVALFVAHHIVCDAWSMDVFASELAKLYTAFVAGEQSPLPDLAVQYADYATWQRQHLRGETMTKLLGYWHRQLDGVGETAALSTDMPRATTPMHRGGIETLVVPAPLRDAVIRFGLDNGATLFMCLLAGFSVVLRQYGGRDDIVVGTDVAGRDRLQTEQLIGFFVNQLVLRANLSGDPAFRELLARIRTETLDAYAHQEMPFDQLVQALRPSRDLSYSPLFQAKLVMPNVPVQDITLPGLTVLPIDLPRTSAQTDLIIRVIDGAAGLEMSAEYDRELFRPGTVRMMVRQLTAVLERATRDPDIRLSALDDVLASVLRQERAALGASSAQRLGSARRRPLDS